MNRRTFIQAAAGSIAALASGIELSWPSKPRTAIHIDQAEPFDLGPGRFKHVILHSDSRLRLIGECRIDRLDVMGRGEVDLRASSPTTIIGEYNALGGYVSIIPAEMVAGEPWLLPRIEPIQ